MSSNALIDLEEAVASEPRPLICSKPELGLLWSAKAGCTFAVKWFLKQAGLLPAAERFDPWIHEYRAKVFYDSEEYRKLVATHCYLDYAFAKFVRNPFSRCVSGYLAFCHLAHTNREGTHQAVFEAIEGVVGRPFGPGRTFSFREFVDFLEAQDLDRCNIHFRRQVHPLEQTGQLSRVYVVQLESAFEVLHQIEADLGLAYFDLSALRHSPHHSTRSEETKLQADRCFTDTLSLAVPDDASFYDDDLVRRVGHLYADDFERYGYSTLHPNMATSARRQETAL